MGLPSRYVGFVLRGSAAESPPVPASGCGVGAAESPPIVPASGGGVGAAQSPPIVSASGGMGAPLAVPVAAVAQSVAVSVSTQTVPISALVMAHRYSSTGCTLEADSRDSWDALVAQLRTETWTSARAGEARQMLAALEGIRDQHAGPAQNAGMLLRATACKRNAELDSLCAVIQESLDRSLAAGAQEKGVDHGHVSVRLVQTAGAQTAFIASMGQIAAAGSQHLEPRPCTAAVGVGGDLGHGRGCRG